MAALFSSKIDKLLEGIKKTKSYFDPVGQDLLWQRYFANNGSFTFRYPITEAEQLWTLRDLVLLLPGFIGNPHPGGWRPIRRQLRRGGHARTRAAAPAAPRTPALPARRGTGSVIRSRTRGAMSGVRLVSTGIAECLRKLSPHTGRGRINQRLWQRGDPPSLTRLFWGRTRGNADFPLALGRARRTAGVRRGESPQARCTGCVRWYLLHRLLQ